MNKELINAYAHGNLHEILLINLYAEMVHHKVENRNLDGATNITTDMMVQGQRANVLKELHRLKFPMVDPAAEEPVRQEASRATDVFFQSVRERLEPPPDDVELVG